MSDAMLTLISTQLTNMQRSSRPQGVSVADYHAEVERANTNADIARQAQAECLRLQKYGSDMQAYAANLEERVAVGKENFAILQQNHAQLNAYADRLEAELKELKRSR